MRAFERLARVSGVGLALGAVASPNLGAQDVEMRGRVHGVKPPPAYYEVLARDPTAYQFQRVWKDLARRVYERRQQLIQAGDYATLNAHFVAGGDVPSRTIAQASAAALTGTFKFPVLVGYFSDSTHTFQPDTASLRAELFGTSAAPPYSVTTFYDEMSNSLLQVQGEVVGWFKVDSVAAYYEGSGNGMDPNNDHTGDFIEELLRAADPTVDFSQYDGDGDGYIDLVAVLHPLKPGECGTSHIWSHRWVLNGWGNSFSGDGKTAWDYMIQAAVGGASGCDDTQIMPIGTFSHELGHGMTNLPDLYDTGGPPPPTEGIGHWGLMGAGNWNIQTSPAHMEAWSKEVLGWIAIDTLTATTVSSTKVLNPIIKNHSALRVDILGTNQYFLLENRQGNGSDANVAGPGLLIWHVDPDLINARWGSNTVNTLTPHGLDLEQADGLDHLGNGVNRGDAGDPWPGSSNNTAFGPSTTPNSELNDNSNSGVQVDSITQNTDSTLALRVRFNVVEERITTNIGAGTEVIVDGSRESAPYTGLWIYPGSLTIEVDQVQGDTLTRYTFQSWSDGGARSHTVSVDATPDTLTANLQTEHRLRATADIQGTISSTVSLDGSGIAWLLPTDSAELTATPTAPEYLFVQWSGDTTFAGDTLKLYMTRPWTVRAVFGLPVVAQNSGALANGVMGAAYTDTLTASGGSGSYAWSQVGSDPLPDGLTLDAQGVVSGVATADGTFQFVVQATSGALTSNPDTVSITITRPVLAQDDVINHLISPVATLTADEERYLDIIGNNNGRYDIGDFRAYLQERGVIADIAPADPAKATDKARKED